MRMKYESGQMHQSYRNNEHPHTVYLGELTDRFNLFKSLCEKEVESKNFTEILDHVDVFLPEHF